MFEEASEDGIGSVGAERRRQLAHGAARAHAQPRAHLQHARHAAHSTTR